MGEPPSEPAVTATVNCRSPPVTEVNVGAAGRYAITCALSAEAASVKPALLVALTLILIYFPTSALVNVYEDVVALTILAKSPPEVKERCHWYSRVGELLQVPPVAVRVAPDSAAPEKVGAAVLTGRPTGQLGVDVYRALVEL